MRYEYGLGMSPLYADVRTKTSALTEREISYQLGRKC